MNYYEKQLQQTNYYNDKAVLGDSKHARANARYLDKPKKEAKQQKETTYGSYRKEK